MLNLLLKISYNLYSYGLNIIVQRKVCSGLILDCSVIILDIILRQYEFGWFKLSHSVNHYLAAHSRCGDVRDNNSQIKTYNLRFNINASCFEILREYIQNYAMV